MAGEVGDGWRRAVSAQGRFITIEGGEGAGKSTQVARLCEHLRGRGIDAVATREPGGPPGAEEIRKLLTTGAVGRWSPWAEALLHFAARHEHLAATVMPALKAGRWVVSDRFADSTTAYQGYGHGLGAGPMAELYRLVVGDFAPDLTLVLDLPVAVGLARAHARRHDENRYESMDVAFHERVRAGFLAVAAATPERSVVIEASAPADAVARAIAETVDRQLAG